MLAICRRALQAFIMSVVALTPLWAVGLGFAWGYTSTAQAQTKIPYYDPKTYIHPRAQALMPTIKKEVEEWFPEIETPWYFPGLIEHESCQYLAHSRCWSATSQLLTKREQGLGLMMTTRTWNADGSVRFDTLSDLKRNYKDALGELSWETLRDRPDLQIRSGIILTRENYRKLGVVKIPFERLKMADSAYNGGLTNVTRSRRACGLAKNCDPGVWFGNVANYNQKSKAILYGNRSALDINSHHVVDVFNTRMPKFKKFWEN